MIKAKFLCIAILIIVPFFGITKDMINDMQKIMIRIVTVIDQGRETGVLGVRIK